MKHTLLLTFALLFALPAWTQEAPQIADNQAEEIEEKILLPVIVRKAKEDKVEAGLTELKPSAVEVGLHRLILEGSKEVSENEDGTKNIKVIWDGASIIKNDGEKKSTYLADPFNSDITVNPDMQSGDEFTAEGKTGDLLAAWQRLMAEDEGAAEEQEEAVPEEEAPQPTQNFGGAAQEQQRPLDFTPPEFVDAHDPVITSTTDGCNIKVDIAQMAAIVQERVLQDGEEITPCSDTLTRYPLEKKYSNCPLFVDTVNLQVLEQYTLAYNDPVSGGQIQVQDCTPDEEEAVPITEDFDSCSIRHDFSEDKSFEQSRLIYTDKEGLIQEVQACMDTETAYDHITTEETCSPIVDTDAGEVIFQFRKKITVDGADMYITQCTPNPATTVAVEEEVCESPRYTHDFSTGQSYLNKTYFYMRDGQRVDILTCGQSEVTFEHQQDETVCSAINDDVNKETTLHARTFIEENPGEKVFISSCEAVEPKVPYTSLGGKWRIRQTSYNVPITPANTQNVKASSVGWPSRFQWYMRCSNGPWSGTPIPGGQLCVHYQFNLYGKHWCMTRNAQAPWFVTNGNLPIDHANSDQSPTYGNMNFRYSDGTFMSSSQCYYYGSYCFLSSSDTQGSFVCGNNNEIRCNVLTELEKNPAYLRGDNSEYIDFNTVQEIRRVCGNGSLLDGEIE